MMNVKRIWELKEQLESAGFPTDGRSVYGYRVDLDERGDFQAGVELWAGPDRNGKDVFNITSGEHLVEMVEDGFMKNGHDIDGLAEYLSSVGIIPKGALIYPSLDLEDMEGELDMIGGEYDEFMKSLTPSGSIKITEELLLDLAGNLKAARDRLIVSGALDSDDESDIALQQAAATFEEIVRAHGVVLNPKLTLEQKDEQDRIIRESDSRTAGRDAYLFARNVPGADIAALQKVVIDHGRGFDAYCFAVDIFSADIAALQQVVIESGDAKDACLFAKNVRGANIPALQTVVIKHGGAEDALEFAKDVPGADVQALQKLVIKRGDALDIYHFAPVPGADKTALRARLAELNELGQDRDNRLADLDAYISKFPPGHPDDALIPAAGQSAGIQPK